jgi:gamma-glutamylputrescine oxidase
VAPTTLGGELLARAMLGEAPIPAVFSEFGLTRMFGKLGLATAQMMYWVMQGRDAVLEWHHSRWVLICGLQDPLAATG